MAASSISFGSFGASSEKSLGSCNSVRRCRRGRISCRRRARHRGGFVGDRCRRDRRLFFLLFVFALRHAFFSSARRSGPSLRLARCRLEAARHAIKRVSSIRNRKQEKPAVAPADCWLSVLPLAEPPAGQRVNCLGPLLGIRNAARNGGRRGDSHWRPLAPRPPCGRGGAGRRAGRRVGRELRNREAAAPWCGRRNGSPPAADRRSANGSCTRSASGWSCARRAGFRSPRPAARRSSASIYRARTAGLPAWAKRGFTRSFGIGHARARPMRFHSRCGGAAG